MANSWQAAALGTICVAQMAAPAVAAELDAWLPLPPVLDAEPVPSWTPTFDRSRQPATNAATTQRQPRRGPGAPAAGPMAGLPTDGVFDFVKYLRVPSPRLGNVELSAAVGGLHTESEQASAKSDMGMDGGPGSTFQLAAKYLVDRHVSFTFGLNGAQAQTQLPSTDPAAQVAAATPKTRPGAMRGFAAISNIGPSMVQRLVSTSVQPSASVQYAGPYGLNLSLGVASNPLDVSGAADVQFHATYRTDFREPRLAKLPAPLGTMGPLK